MGECTVSKVERRKPLQKELQSPDRRKRSVSNISNRDDRGAASCSPGPGLRRWESSFIVKMESSMSRVGQTQQTNSFGNIRSHSAPNVSPQFFPGRLSLDSYEQPERGMGHLKETWGLKNGDAGFCSGTGVLWSAGWGLGYVCRREEGKCFFLRFLKPHIVLAWIGLQAYACISQQREDWASCLVPITGNGEWGWNNCLEVNQSTESM